MNGISSDLLYPAILQQFQVSLFLITNNVDKANIYICYQFSYNLDYKLVITTYSPSILNLAKVYL